MLLPTDTEGVIKFDCRFELSAPMPASELAELIAWRKIFFQLGLIGQSAGRYDGLGFGNISQRVGFDSQFAISGTQTGALPDLCAEHFSLVRHCDAQRNLVVALGPIKPSSESLTHGALYALDTTIRCVIHAHSPHIWRAADLLYLPTTSATVPYGTPAMAEEIARLWRQGQGASPGVFVMAGHEDGVIAFGDSLSSAGLLLIEVLARSYSESPPE